MVSLMWDFNKNESLGAGEMASLAMDPGSLPSSHMAAQSHLQLHFQESNTLASPGTACI